MCVLREMTEQLFFKLAQVTAGDYRHLDNGKESSEQSRHFRIDCGLALRQRAVEIENDKRSYRLIPDKTLDSKVTGHLLCACQIDAEVCWCLEVRRTHARILLRGIEGEQQFGRFVRWADPRPAEALLIRKRAPGRERVEDELLHVH